MRRRALPAALSLLALAAAGAGAGAGPGAADARACPPGARAACLDPSLYPPWQYGANNDARDRGVTFTVPEADTLADLHGSPTAPLLALYVGGNAFFAMAPLVAAFEAAHPALAGRLYWETLPPGILARQLRAGGTITVGNMTWTAPPDVFCAGLGAVRRLIADGLLTGPAQAYARNTLAIMVPAGNPAGVQGLTDLARPALRLAMPNPETEGVARQIRAALERAGGPALAEAVYTTKVHDGSTRLTEIHHRQTPLFLMQGTADAGVTWRSEAIFQEQIGHPISHVDIPAAQNATGIYAGAVVRGAAHAAAAAQWLDFLRTPTAQAILARYGFEAAPPGADE